MRTILILEYCSSLDSEGTLLNSSSHVPCALSQNKHTSPQKMFTGLFGNSPTYAYAADKINYMEKVVKQKESVQPWGFYVEKLLLTSFLKRLPSRRISSASNSVQLIGKLDSFPISAITWFHLASLNKHLVLEWCIWYFNQQTLPNLDNCFRMI